MTKTLHFLSMGLSLSMSKMRRAIGPWQKNLGTVSACPRTHIANTEANVVYIPPAAPSLEGFLLSGACDCSQPPWALPILETSTVETH